MLELGTNTSPEMPKFKVKADFNADWGGWMLSRDLKLEEPSAERLRIEVCPGTKDFS